MGVWREAPRDHWSPRAKPLVRVTGNKPPEADEVVILEIVSAFELKAAA